MDCYLLKYELGDYIPVHTDPVDGKKHYRLNIELKKAKAGGIFEYLTNNGVWKTTGRFTIFRPDKIPHRVSKITNGKRYVLSCGIAI